MAEIGEDSSNSLGEEFPLAGYGAGQPTEDFALIPNLVLDDGFRFLQHEDMIALGHESVDDPGGQGIRGRDFEEGDLVVHFPLRQYVPQDRVADPSGDDAQGRFIPRVLEEVEVVPPVELLSDILQFSIQFLVEGEPKLRSSGPPFRVLLEFGLSVDFYDGLERDGLAGMADS